MKHLALLLVEFPLKPEQLTKEIYLLIMFYYFRLNDKLDLWMCNN